MKADFATKEFFISLKESFHSPRPYCRPPKKPGSGFLVLLAVTAVLFIPGYINLLIMVNTIKREVVDPLVYRLPVMEVIQGRVTSAAKQPYEIRLGDQLMFVLDTTGQINSLEESGALAFMGPDGLAVYEDQQRTKIRRLDLSDTDYLLIDPLSIKNWTDSILPFLYPLAFLVTLGGIYIFRIVQLLAYVAVSMIVLKSRGKEASFEEILNAGVYAMVPAMSFEVLLMFLPFYFPGRGLLFYVIYAGYMWWGISALLEGRDADPGPEE
ncbi:DUF1189 family protein [Marispirochaeta sp.]|uniref:DUF1189 family protein n=1 Tax=Marispirochaeta sp. TaxID=2038653 RepID=UPI0029C63B78|nr:DUF1189 family protein [Marispirochaeta sp.]